MEFLKKLTDKKAPYSFFIRFLLCFFILYFFFPFYRGLTGEGGMVYSSFLDTHLNLIRGFTSILTGSAAMILGVFNFHTSQHNYHSLQIDYSRGVSVNPSCLGWAVMSFWVAFVYANPGSWKHKLKWTLGGVVSIIILNITRIMLIVVANHKQWKQIITLDHHALFNIFSYACIFLLMFWFIRMQKKYEGIQFSAERSDHSFSRL